MRDVLHLRRERRAEVEPYAFELRARILGRLEHVEAALVLRAVESVSTERSLVVMIVCSQKPNDGGYPPKGYVRPPRNRVFSLGFDDSLREGAASAGYFPGREVFPTARGASEALASISGGT